MVLLILKPPILREFFEQKMIYFSEKENGSKARNSEQISPKVWGGIVSIVQSFSKSGGFGLAFPLDCRDGGATIGTDESMLSLRLGAEIPELEWPLQTTQAQDFSYDRLPFAPDTLVILDFIQFCYMAIAKPIQENFHSFFQHYHLTFDEQTGKDEFRMLINRVFARNGLVYELSQNGEIVRLAPPVLRELLNGAAIHSGDVQLDHMLEEARRKFLSPDLSERSVALERLWDCWERLKSSAEPSDKKKSVAKLLESASPETTFREMLNREARELTEIGNSFHIRHSEVTQQPITSSSHIDYLFHRLYSMVFLLLRQ